MAEKRFLAVCMPVYNAEDSVSKSIETILAQSFGNFTFFITDDCSTDGTAKVIEGIDDSRLVLLKNSINKGAAATRNDMMQRCIDRGFKYMAIMDSDDIAYPDRLKKQIEILENDPSLAVCGSSMKIERNNSIWHAPATPSEVKAECVFGNPIPTSTATIRLRYIRQYNLFWVKSFVPCADYHLWYLMLFKHNLRACNTGDVDMVYSFSPGGISHGRGIAKQEEKDAAVKQLILNTFNIETTSSQAYHFMKVALSRSNSVDDALDFTRLANELKVNNDNRIVDQRELELRLSHRLSNYLGKVSALDPVLKQEMIDKLLVREPFRWLSDVLRYIKHSFLDRYFPQLSYRLLLLYRSISKRP